MSFNVVLEKNEQGTYDVKSTSPETLPDHITIDGHVGDDGQVLDLSARVSGLYASSSRREYPMPV